MRIELEYEGKPVTITVPDSFKFEVGDVLMLRRETSGAITLSNPRGDLLPIVFKDSVP